MASPRAGFADFAKYATDFLKAFWVPLFGVVSAVAFIYKFVQLWRGDWQTVTVIVSVVFYLIFLSTLIHLITSTTPSQIDPSNHVHRYSRRGRRIARIILFTWIVLPIIIGAKELSISRKGPEPKPGNVVILVTRFGGKDIQGRDTDSYRINDQVLAQLRKSLGEYDDAIIIPIDESLTELGGAERAKVLAKENSAALVLWDGMG